MTEPGSVMGTPAFMPPEQAGGENERINQRSDVFSLGAILCVILTGQPPYKGKTDEHVVQEQHYVGACLTGMKPGDRITGRAVLPPG